VSNLDAAVARLLASLDELDLAASTLVIFRSDNGPELPSDTPVGAETPGDVA
jgi:arylsulfatase A-like enzyme